MSRSSKPEKTQSFESAMTELEGIVAAMEAGQLPLEETLNAYRRGAELLKYCQAALQDAQQQVRILEEDTLRAFSASADADEQ